MTDRPSYADLVAAVDQLMLAYSTELRGGSTPELRAATAATYAQLTTLLYAAADRPPEPWAPPPDPRLPIKRRHSPDG